MTVPPPTPDDAPLSDGGPFYYVERVRIFLHYARNILIVELTTTALYYYSYVRILAFYSQDSYTRMTWGANRGSPFPPSPRDFSPKYFFFFWFYSQPYRGVRRLRFRGVE